MLFAMLFVADALFKRTGEADMTTVRTLQSLVAIGGRDYHIDIVIELTDDDPQVIIVSAHHGGLIVEELYEAQPGDISILYKRDDCLRLVREHNLIPQATDDLAALMARRGKSLQ